MPTLTMRTSFLHPALAAIAFVACGASAAAQQTIVGKWAIKGKCLAPLSTIVIEPMELVGEDFYCDFATVKREGNVVRWAGKCNFSEEGYKPDTVTARLAGSKLYYRFAGMGWNGPFDRCPKS